MKTTIDLFGKRILSELSLVAASLISIILVLILLAGCTSTTTTTSATTAATTTTAAAPTNTTPANPELILSSTTSVRDSGLMDKLIPLFEQETGYTVKPIYNGSGAAIALGEQGEADVLIVHSPSLEKAFMDAGNGSDRRLIMHNDFVVLGPVADPAGVKGASTAKEAFQKIANAQANFYSRGDNSGTDAKDKSIFKSIGITVEDKSPNNPSWYLESGSGMGQLLLIADEKQAYTLSDRATYLANKANLSLEILFEGDPTLLNLYHVITVNPNKSSKINAEGAKAFADFMVGETAQKVIGEFTDKNGQLLFTPDGGKTDADLGIQ